MASRGSPSPPPQPPHSAAAATNRESFLTRKKKEIVERSMARFQESLDRCLDNSVSAASAVSAASVGGGGVLGGVVPKRVVKRGREEEDGGGCGELGSGGGRAVKAAKKKKVNPKEVPGKKLGCPFARHDPARYKSVKTCCGPGWADVHRVKEHIYRRHSLKNFCPRCFDHFDEPEALKSHQRADIPCKVKAPVSDGIITEEQDKQLHQRAKSNCTEEEKWDEMYRIIFPGEEVPSPYYEADTSTTPKPETSRFQSLDECKEFLRAELPRLVRPVMEQYVTGLFEELQEKVDRKTVEIIFDLETKVLRTFHFQEEQFTLSALSATTPGYVAATAVAVAEPSPPPSPSPEMSKVSALLDDMKDDEFANELFANAKFDLESFLEASHQGLSFGGCENFSVDSAYYSGSSNGGVGVDGRYRSFEGF